MMPMRSPPAGIVVFCDSDTAAAVPAFSALSWVWAWAKPAAAIRVATNAYLHTAIAVFAGFRSGATVYNLQGMDREGLGAHGRHIATCATPRRDKHDVKADKFRGSGCLHNHSVWRSWITYGTRSCSWLPATGVGAVAAQRSRRHSHACKLAAGSGTRLTSPLKVSQSIRMRSGCQY